MKILIDTDIGGDVDDALALAMALNTPELEIVGITNVYLGNAWRGSVTRNMLKTWGMEERIPVSAGAEKPLLGWWDDNHSLTVPESYGRFCGQELPYAPDMIVRLAKKYKHLTILAIGPLTNVALALAKAPEIVPEIQIVMMGGQIFSANPEWNIQCDPEAARIVLESGVKLTMVGKDVTDRCQFTREEVDSVWEAGNPRRQLLWQMMGEFTEKWGYLPILHDPLALAALIWPEVLTLENKQILIETRGEFTRGVTVDCSWGAGASVLVATDVNVPEFKRRVLEKLRQ